MRQRQDGETAPCDWQVVLFFAENCFSSLHLLTNTCFCSLLYYFKVLQYLSCTELWNSMEIQISFFNPRLSIAPLSLGSLFKLDPLFQVPDNLTGNLTLKEAVAEWEPKRTTLQSWVFVWCFCVPQFLWKC